jgi:hypothetical protein
MIMMIPKGIDMKRFFERYSYQSVVLFLNQIAIAIFGLVLALAAGMAKNEVLKIVTSSFSIVFFLFLQYGTAWKVGAEDRVSIDLGKMKKDLSVPVKMWLLSNSVNLLLAVFITLGMLLPDVAVFSSGGGVGATAALLIEGMYTGILSLDVLGAPLNSYWFMYFAITLPSLLVVFVAYVLGVKNVTFTRLFLPSAPKDKSNRK